MEMADKQNGNGQASPLVGFANFLNEMAPHNVLRKFMQGVPPPPPPPGLPPLQVGGQLPGMGQQQAQQPVPPQPAAQMPEGKRVRQAKRMNLTDQQYQQMWADQKAASEHAGFSVEKKTIIF